MKIQSCFDYPRERLNSIIVSELSTIAFKKVGIIYGETSEEDRLYIRRKPRSEWSINDVEKGLSSLGLETKWIDPTKDNFVSEVVKFDAAFINAHGDFGEDGNLQGLLAYLGVPYTGSGILTSAIAADKRLTKLVLSSSGVKCPSFFRVDFSNLGSKLIGDNRYFVKAVNGGSSVGVEFVCTSSGFVDAVQRIREQGFSDIIAESFIEGSSVTVPAICVKGDAIMLPPVLCITKNDFYDQESKLMNRSDFVEYQTITDLSDSRLEALHCEMRKILNVFEFEGAIRIDFIINESNDVYALEINSIPGIQRNSNLVLSAEAININYPSLLGIILNSAFNFKKLVPWSR